MTEIIAPIINFCLVLGGLIFFTRKQVAAFFSTRSAAIAKEVDEAKSASAQSLEARKNWETKWNSREAELARYRTDALQALERNREKGAENAKHEAERIKKEAQLMATSEAGQSKARLGRELVEQSILLAKAYMKDNLDDKDKQRLVGDYVELVGHGASK